MKKIIKQLLERVEDKANRWEKDISAFKILVSLSGFNDSLFDKNNDNFIKKKLPHVMWNTTLK